MPLSRAEVEHVARLAHVALTVEEAESLTGQLSSVLDHIAMLQEVDISGVPPTSHVVPMNDVMRDDEPRPSWSPEAVLANAPRRLDDYFEVQAILD